MPFTLLYTHAFIKDLEDDIRPIPGLVDVLKKQLDHLADNPTKFQSSLQTYKYGANVHKSRIDNAYRMLWAYHGKNEILMLRAGEHDYINEDAAWRDMKAARYGRCGMAASSVSGYSAMLMTLAASNAAIHHGDSASIWSKASP